ncbi:lysophospholipid acyltransferase family protein [Ramlibacter sp. 2FC]|uniref:lysophospholipid acyltransferase family protein n=1 Tax=Ramlibacter sp. 2FC TaxID=2502188 RepID=UPI0010F813B9|nr:lysophospholipid acyltransferase family protein [Ramlibacter sp. 2FC]
MKLFGALAKLWRGLLHIAVGLWTIYAHFPQLAPTHREARVQAWAQRLLALWGIELVVRGQPPHGGPVLLVANHISWLDIVVMHAARHCRFVSKSDVKHWPLVGTLAGAAGTLYLERSSRRDAMRVVQHMAEALREGDVLAVFPEGTTSDGLTLLPFHANLIQAAIAAEVPAQPVALQFVDRATGQLSLAPCYIGDDTLVGSIWRTLTTHGIQAVVSFGEPQRADGRDRRAWANALRHRIAELREPAQRKV